MPELLAAINVLPKSDEVFLRRVLDNGHFVRDLARVGLRAVVTTRDSFETGRVRVPVLGATDTIRSFQVTEVDPSDLVVVHNRIIQPSKGGYLADKLVINSDAHKQRVADGTVEEICRDWMPPEGSLPTLPAQLTQNGIPVQPPADAELRCYATTDRTGRIDFYPVLRIPVPGGPARYEDVQGAGQTHMEMMGMTLQVAETLGLPPGVTRPSTAECTPHVGALTLAAVDGELVVTGMHFKAPELPTTKEAPFAARGLYRNIARNLAEMRA